MTITIRENEVKSVAATEAICYPEISSCMSITLLLTDGSKVGAHAAQFYDTGAVLTGRMNALVGSKTISAVKAKGHGGCWGTQLGSQFDLAPTAIEQWKNANPDAGREPNDIDIRPQMEALFINANVNGFTTWLNGQFGVQNATFTDMNEDGDVNLDAAGNFV